MQIKLILWMLLFAVAGTANAQSKVSVEIEGIENQKREMMIALFDEAGFLKMPVAARSKTIEMETLTVVFDSIAPGDYAISVFQDENGNGELDRGAFGIPVEPFGFSNNTGGGSMIPAFSKYKLGLPGIGDPIRRLDKGCLKRVPDRP